MGALWTDWVCYTPNKRAGASESDSRPIPMLCAAFIHADPHTHGPQLTLLNSTIFSDLYTDADIDPITCMPPINELVYDGGLKLLPLLSIPLESVLYVNCIADGIAPEGVWVHRLVMRSDKTSHFMTLASAEAAAHVTEVMHEIIQDNIAAPIAQVEGVFDKGKRSCLGTIQDPGTAGSPEEVLLDAKSALRSRARHRLSGLVKANMKMLSLARSARSRVLSRHSLDAISTLETSRPPSPPHHVNDECAPQDMYVDVIDRCIL